MSQKFITHFIYTDDIITMDFDPLKIVAAMWILATFAYVSALLMFAQVREDVAPFTDTPSAALLYPEISRL